MPYFYCVNALYKQQVMQCRIRYVVIFKIMKGEFVSMCEEEVEFAWGNCGKCYFRYNPLHFGSSTYLFILIQACDYSGAHVSQNLNLGGGGY